MSAEHSQQVQSESVVNEQVSNESVTDKAKDTTKVLTGDTSSASETKETVVDSSSESGESFLNSLSDDLKSNKTLSTFKSVEDLAKSYVNLQKSLGKKVSEMSPEELKAVSEKFGVPESKDKYELPKSDIIDDETASWFKDVAYEAGLPKEAAKSLVEQYSKRIEAQLKMQQDSFERQQNAWAQEVKKEFGGAYNERVDMANKALREFGGEELIEFINQSGIGNHPALVKAFANAGKLISEGSFQDTKSSTGFKMTPAEAKQAIADFKASDYYKKGINNPVQRQEIFNRLDELYKVVTNTN